MSKKIIDDFNKLYYNSGLWQKRNTWCGRRILKTPTDLFVYQEIIFKHRPTLIIETGTAYGGTTLFLAQMMDLVGIDGQVVSIDIALQKGLPQHNRVTYIQGSSSKHHVLKQVNRVAKQHEEVMVILDSDHSKAHVAKELRKFGRLTSQGQYMVVEDTNLNGRPVRRDFGLGPFEAVQDFLKTDNSFEVDVSMEKHMLTFNPSGFLKKIKKSENQIIKEKENDKN